MSAPRNVDTQFEPLMRTDEVRAALRISPAYLWQLIRDGELPVVRMGRRTLVRPETLRAFVASHETPRNDDDPAVTGSAVRTSAGAGGGDDEQ